MELMGILKYKIEKDGIVITGCAKDIKLLSIPAKIDGYPVKVIGCGAFRGHTQLETVVLPPTIERICAGAFENCSNLYHFELASPETTFEGMNIFTGARYSMTEYLKKIRCQVLNVEFQDDER